MRWSMPIGRVFGIPIGIHVTFLLIVAWAAWLGGQYAGTVGAGYAIGMVLLLFTCVVLHELGHSVVAMRYGVQVDHITLLPIGGVAALRAMPEEPWQELLVALAGPLVNVGILGLTVPWWGWPSWVGIPPIPGNPAELMDALVRANALLIIFNMIPAFPMDGGRVLRASLAMIISYRRATAIASWIGRILGILFILAGLLVNPFLLLIGFFVVTGAIGENRMVQTREALRGVTVADCMDIHHLPVIQESGTLRDCLRRHYTYGQGHFVVCDARGRVCGLLPEDNWVEAVKRYGLDESIAPYMVQRFIQVSPQTDLWQLTNEHQHATQRLFPVVQEGRLQGVLSIRPTHRRHEPPPPLP